MPRVKKNSRRYHQDYFMVQSSIKLEVQDWRLNHEKGFAGNNRYR